MSNVIGHGIDLVECSRIAELGERYGAMLLDRIITHSEQEYCRLRKRRWEHLAGRFAVKEAVLKALGTGLRGQMAWTDVQVTNDGLGRPIAIMEGHVRKIADEKGVTEVLISISHTKDQAIASAIAISQ